ncbi:conserved hypothetical protein [Ricinus communis]|uniref:Uncharacterized protein n=1 Tax=Ricinus communis TaxID=3988 RepID=B9TB83_RICCO|nr:conserved hypothetical protein [Ricinus communis]
MRFLHAEYGTRAAKGRQANRVRLARHTRSCARSSRTVVRRSGATAAIITARRGPLPGVRGGEAGSHVIVARLGEVVVELADAHEPVGLHHANEVIRYRLKRGFSSRRAHGNGDNDLLRVPRAHCVERRVHG